MSVNLYARDVFYHRSQLLRIQRLDALWLYAAYRNVSNQAIIVTRLTSWSHSVDRGEERGGGILHYLNCHGYFRSRIS